MNTAHTRVGMAIGSMLLCSAFAFAQTGARLSIEDLARAHDPSTGPLFISILGALPSRTAEELVLESDLVVDGTVLTSEPRVSADGRIIETLVTMQPHGRLFEAPGVPPAIVQSPVRVRTPGGNLTLLGRHVSVNVNDVPPPIPGKRLILFLNQDTTDEYTIAYHHFGMFEVRDGKVTSYKGLDEFNGWLPADESVFRTRIAEAAQHRPR